MRNIKELLPRCEVMRCEHTKPFQRTLSQLKLAHVDRMLFLQPYTQPPCTHSPVDLHYPLRRVPEIHWLHRGACRQLHRGRAGI